jgi:Flp pilus assembly protein CpaB
MSPTAPTQKPAGGTTLILTSLGLALAAVIVTNVYIAQIKKQVQGDSFTVYRLTRPVTVGHRLGKQDIQAVQVPNEYQDSFRGFVDTKGLDARIGDTIKREADQNEFLRYSMFLQPDGAGAGDASNITQGMRWVKIPVNSRSLPGALKPGMLVDIEAPFDLGGTIFTVMPVMERVKILALGSITEADEASGASAARLTGGFRTITVELSPEEATQMVMVKLAAAGEFELLLRNPSDVELRKIKRGGINPDVLELVQQRSRNPAPAGAKTKSRATNE